MARLATSKICIVGYGRHGKDTVAEALHNQGLLRFCGSTSWQLLPYMEKILGLPAQVCWDTRHERRELWKSYADFLRRDDPLLLIRLALRKGNIVSGIRDKVEMDAAIEQKIFDAVVWVERPGFPVDLTVTFDKTLATTVLVNDASVDVLKSRARIWAKEKGFV